MGDIVYWDFGEYDTNRDVISATIEPTPGGILVDWGGGDVETLTGTTWSTEEIKNGCTRWNFQRRGKYRANGQVFLDWQNVNLISELQPIFYEKFECNQGLTYRFQSVGVRQNYLLICGEQTYNTSVVCGTGQKTLFEYTYLSTAASNLWEFRNFSKQILQVGSLIGYRITSNTGATSTRLKTTVSVGLITGCRIKITYSDNSIQYIPFSTCPPWVAVRPTDQCPDGSCRVDCGDHYCCFDSCSGVPVKEIPK